MFELIESYRGHRIERRPPGFEFTPVLLGKVTSYLVHWAQGGRGVFAFMYRFAELGPDGAEIDETSLAEQAVALIRGVIDRNEATAGYEATHELAGGRWLPVADPRWWVPSFPPPGGSRPPT